MAEPIDHDILIREIRINNAYKERIHRGEPEAAPGYLDALNEVTRMYLDRLSAMYPAGGYYPAIDEMKKFTGFNYGMPLYG